MQTMYLAHAVGVGDQWTNSGVHARYMLLVGWTLFACKGMHTVLAFMLSADCCMQCVPC
jgi:hypothetical protein